MDAKVHKPLMGGGGKKEDISKIYDNVNKDK